MTWFKVCDQSTFHPKVMAAGNEAWGAFTRMGSYSAAHNTEGKVMPTIATSIASKKVLQKLIEVGLLHFEDGQYIIHDYLDYNPTAEQVRSKREARAEAGRKGGLNSAQAKQKSKGQAIASTNDEAKSNPDPTRPTLSYDNEPPNPHSNASGQGEASVVGKERDEYSVHGDPFDPTIGIPGPGKMAKAETMEQYIKRQLKEHPECEQFIANQVRNGKPRSIVPFTATLWRNLEANNYEMSEDNFPSRQSDNPVENVPSFDHAGRPVSFVNGESTLPLAGYPCRDGFLYLREWNPKFPTEHRIDNRAREEARVMAQLRLNGPDTTQVMQ